MKKLLIWGAGDQGLVTLDCALAMQIYDRIDFLDFKEKGHRKIPESLILKEKAKDLDWILHSYDEVIVATGDNDLRKKKIAILEEMKIPIPTIIHPSAIISSFAKVSKGCTILANAVINVNAVVGIGSIINTETIIEHDCIVGDYVNISPKVAMAGHTKIGNLTFIGIGCTIIDNIIIGNEVILGAGAVVVYNIPPHSVAMGVPAKVR